MTKGGGVKIRPIVEADLVEILQIEETAFPNPYPLGYLRFLAKGNPDTFLVAENDSGIVGYIIADVRHGNEGHVISVAVRQNERRKGIAKELIAAVDSVFGRAEVDVVKLEVRVSNLVAINLYHSMGYRDAGIIPGYYRDGEDALRMVARVGGRGQVNPRGGPGGAR